MTRLYLSSAVAAVLAVAMPAWGAAMAQDHANHQAEAESLPAATLTAYRDALVALDAEAAGKLFTEDSSLFENGKPEGSWANYLEHHLGPELGHFESFSFPRYEVEVRQMGDLAHGEERYSYRIQLHDGRVVERDGVATSLLRREGDRWLIVSHHSSSRSPK